MLIAGRLTEAQRQAQRQAQLDKLANLYTEYTDVSHPMAPLGATPLRTRAELRQHFAATPSVPGIERFEAEGHVHKTADPELVIFEFRYVGAVNGRPFALPCLFVTRVRHGVIVESRDYGDHVGLAAVLGRLDALAAALADTTRPWRDG